MVYFVKANYQIGTSPNERLTEISTYVKATDTVDAIKEFSRYLNRNDYPEYKYHPTKISVQKVPNM